MVGRQTLRRSVTFLLGVAACSAFLFALGASQPRAAGDIFERLRDGVRDGIRTLTGRSESRSSQSPAVIRAESPRAFAMEMDRLARDLELLRLPAGDVDPLRDGGAPVDRRLPAGFHAQVTSFLAAEPMEDPETGHFVPEDVEYWLVQFGENRSSELRDEFEQLGGVEIVGFWPNAAYLVRAESGQVGPMRSLSSARWSGRFEPSHKVDVRLREQLAAGDDLSALALDQRGQLRILVSLHRGVPAQPYLDLIAAIDGLAILHSYDYPGEGGLVQIELPPFALADALLQLAQLRDVASIALDEVPSTHNDHSVWYMQTGIADSGLNNFDTTARLFALGINGRGLGGFVADDGVENGLCQFRYTDNLEDVTYQTLTDTPLAVEGATLADPRTRLRKISAYIVLNGAAPYSSPDQHGTGTAGCMLGDNYGHATTGGSLAARPFIRDIGRSQNLTSCENPTRTWRVGQTLRLTDPEMVVDDPTVDDPTIVNSYGTNVEHHDARDGMAPGAHLVVGDIGDANGNLTGVLFGFQAVDLAWSYGATSMNMSFGGGNCTACYSGAAPGADLGAWLHRMVLPFSSAGNEGGLGTGTIGFGFAHGKNVVTVGATVRGNTPSAGVPRSGENIATYSGRGPKSGGLLAPNLVAPGTIVTAANSSLAVNSEDGSGSGAAGCIVQQGGTQGTSFASPTLAGMALLVQQYFLDGWYPTGTLEPANAMRPTNALTRAVLTNSARDLGGSRTSDDGLTSAHRPTFGQGWGAPRLDDTLFFEGDPVRGVDPFGDTQRARMIVLTDTPNGLNDTGLLLPEPGGTLRNQIVQNFQPAITEGAIHEFPLNIIKNPSDPMDPADELRITMCYSDVQGGSPTGRTTVNDLDLEAISPSGVVYRTNPLTSWDLGYTLPAVDQEPQSFAPFVGFEDYADRDPNNMCENVFLAPQDVEQGTWTIRVIGYQVPGNGNVRNDGTPNFVNDQAPNVDTSVPCDGIPDIDSTDQIFSTRQGYALLVSGNFTTTQGTVALNRTSFLCEGQALGITVSDQNGDQAAEPPCADRTEVTVSVETTTPDAGFTADRELVILAGAEPIYQTADNLPILVVSDPALVVHGDGIIQIAEGQQILVTYLDTNPCGGRASAQATVACRPSVSNQGFSIAEGCDLSDPSDPMSEIRPDSFLDAGELNVYTARFANNGGDELTDVVLSLRPDPDDPLMTAVLPGGLPGSSLIDVLNSPQPVGLAPPGRISDARFLIQMGIACNDPSIPLGSQDCDPSDGTVSGIPPQYSMDFIVCVSSPADGLLYPDCFNQTQSLESDIESFRYDTRDPAGELYGLGLIERQFDGPAMSTNPNDYLVNTPMWYDPAADCDPVAPGLQACGAICNVPRSMWDAANLAAPGTGMVPPPQCFAFGATGNPTDPWDFEDDDEGFQPAVYDGDPNQVGPAGAPGGQEWFWKNAASGGGGCGWEDEVISQISVLGVGVHPDVPANPWGIWHTGAINSTTSGPYPDAMPPNQGVPFNPDESSPNFRTILWRPVGLVTDNSNGEWCDSYISNTALTDFYRSFLMPPTLYRVHRSEPEYRVEFEEFRAYSRMDGHTIDGDNLAIAGWYFSNEPIPPINPSPRSHTWGQAQEGTLIFSDDVRSDWSDDDTFIDANLRRLNPSFPDFTYEDFFGPAEDSWNFMLTWGHLHFGSFASDGQYGWGIDDVSFVWTESRDIPDGSNCGSLVNPLQPPLIFLGESRYNACEGDLDIIVHDRAQTLPVIAVCVSSAAEDFEIALLRPTGRAGEYAGTIPFSADPRFAGDGLISIISGQVDVGRGADTVVVEYDPFNASDHDPSHPDFDAMEACDWMDENGDGRNDDTDDDGIPDAEDGALTGRDREVRDSAAMNCTSGVIFVIKHELEDFDAAGDGDRFADRGETVWMSLQLASQLDANLQDVEVTITTEDDTVCILQDTVILDELVGNNILTDTPIDPLAQDGRRGFLFAVPSSVRTTNLEQPKQVTFRIDVKGLRQDDLNEFTTFGDGFNSFLPLELTLFLDLDELVTTADYVDPVVSPPRDPGQYREGFEGQPFSGRFDHPRQGGQPGWSLQPLIHDARLDTRYGADANNGFCPECTDCAIPDDCEYAFDGVAPPNFSEWRWTTDWAYTGVGAMKFGEVAAGPMRQDQNYREGQYTSIESQPLYLANSPGITPELSFRHIADFWQVTFTGGLSTVLGSGVLEVSANPAGLPTAIRQASAAEINRLYPTSSFRRVYPYQQGYDSVTDALNACVTLYCGYHHPVFGTQGDPLTASGDVRAGIKGGTWEEVRVDLSDYRGMQVVFRWTVSVLQDLDIQSGRIGWLLDDITVDGVSTRTGLALETDVPVEDPCGIIAAVQTTSPDCFGDEVYIFDRHTGLGAFDPGPGPGAGSPFPIEYEWTIGGSTVRGFEADTAIDPANPSAWRGRCDNPILRLSELVAGPGRYPLTVNYYQGGMLSGSTVLDIIYKDAPVPAFVLVSDGPFQGAQTRFAGSATVLPSPDPARSLVYTWDFGDGSVPDTSGPNVNHVFPSAGTYDVELCVRDEDGCEACVTTPFVVVAAPAFGSVVSAVSDDCADPSSPAGVAPDGNPDFNEYVTIDLSFSNSGVAATGVVGYLSTSVDEVEIVQGTADFGNVAGMGGNSASRPFTFIYRNDGGAVPTCLVVPFTLTLVGNGGTVVQEVPFSVTMGNGVDVADATALAGRPCSFVKGDPNGLCSLTKAGPPGCLDGMRFRVAVNGTNRATLGEMNVTLSSPSGITVGLHFGDGVDLNRNFLIDCEFGVDPDPPIPDTGGALTCSEGVLPEVTAATLIQTFTGEPLDGASPWRIEVRPRLGTGADAGSVYTVAEAVLELEGKQSTDLEIAVEGACDGCIAPMTPIYRGLRVSCVPGETGTGALTWTPAVDTTTCGGVDDLQYQLYVSTVAGQLGSPAPILGMGMTCDGNAGSAFPRNPGASTWRVCGVDTYFWTVVVSDDGAAGTRVPAVSAPADAVAPPFQSTTINCLIVPDGPIMGLTKAPGGATLELWVEDPMLAGGRASLPALRPGTGSGYTVFRGSIGSLWSASGGNPSGYNHTTIACSVPGPSVDIGAQAGIPGQPGWYYLMPANGSGGCGGLGYRGSPRPAGGLEFIEGRPNGANGAGCPPFEADCLP